MAETIYEQYDSDLKGTDNDRSRAARSIALPALAATAVFGSAWVAGNTANGIYEHPLVLELGRYAGGAAGALGTYFLARRSIINNEVNTSFTTVDALRSFFGKNNPYVTYGPGFHICFPWEQRSAKNTISLAENSVSFTFQVLCSDGLLTGTGSLRLRANIGKAITYLGGYRAIADDVSELVEVEAVKRFAGKTISTATKGLAELNHALEQLFGTSDSIVSQNLNDAKNLSEFEKRFGVHIADVTTSKLLPSEELQRTYGAVAEAGLIKKGTAAILGLSAAEVKRRLTAGTMTQETYNEARDRFLSVSGNLENMDISRTEFKLMGLDSLDPELAKAIVSVAPMLARLMASMSGKKGGKK